MPATQPADRTLLVPFDSVSRPASLSSYDRLVGVGLQKLGPVKPETRLVSPPNLFLRTEALPKRWLVPSVEGRTGPVWVGWPCWYPKSSVLWRIGSGKQAGGGDIWPVGEDQDTQ